MTELIESLYRLADSAFDRSSDSEHLLLMAAITEIERLRTQVTDLQTVGSRLVMERQNMNAFGDRARRQQIVLSWAARVFGPKVVDVRERALRLLEESIEVAQAAGVKWRQISELVMFVWSKPPGLVPSELGGVAVTLMAFCEAIGVQVEDVEREELERVLSLPEEKARNKHALKVELGVGLDCT